jgi:hypothetical protein
MDSFPIAQYTLQHIPHIFVDDINSMLYKMDPYLFQLFTTYENDRSYFFLNIGSREAKRVLFLHASLLLSGIYISYVFNLQIQFR